MFLLCVVGLTAKFWHIIYGVNGSEGVFGYKYMSSFLYAIGNEIAFLTMALLVLYKSRLTVEFSKSFKWLGILGLVVSSFFIIEILVPKKQLFSWFGVNQMHKVMYYSLMLVFSLASCGLLVLFQEAMIKTEAALRKKLTYVIEFLFKVKNEYYKSIAVKAVDYEKNNAPIDGVSALSQINEFDNELWKTLEKTSE